MSPEKGVLLAATEGQRLRPLTNVIPKPLIPVDGKPLIFYSLELFENLNIKDVTVVIEPRLGHMIKTAIEKKYMGGLNIGFTVQQKHNGIGFAILECQNQIGDESFIVRFADEYHPHTRTLKQCDFNRDETVLVVRREEKPKYLYQNTNVVVDVESNKVREVNRPQNGTPSSAYHLCGLMSFTSYFFDTLKQFSNKPDSYTRNGEFSTLTSIQHMINTQGSVGFVECDGFYANINTFRDLMDTYKYSLLNK